MDKKRILFAEDEPSIRNLVKLNLEEEGYTVTVAVNGAQAIEFFKEARYDLVILDIMMPEMDGYTVCETIRLTDNNVPVLFLSAKGSGEERVHGLKKGADDFLSKPFHLEELLIRVRRLIQRNESNSPGIGLTEYRFGNNYINFESYEAVGINGKFTLTKKEGLLLKLLIENAGEVVSREKILHTVWGYSVFPATRTIDNFILSFRKYFEPDPKNPLYFHSLRGIGYKFLATE